MSDESKNIVKRLRRLDCCAVSDALDRLKLHGAVTGIPLRAGAGRIAGQVTTLKLGTGEPPPGPPVHLGCTAIELSGPDHVIVIEQRSGIEAACWGGLLSLGAKTRGVAGIIADGAVRDIDEAVTYQFPVFARGLTCRTARGRVVEKGTNIPVEIGEIAVNPGDYVLADSSGIVFLPRARAEEILDIAETVVMKEAVMSKGILSGTPISQVMGKTYEQMLKDS
ncbi:diguanylate cyclase [Acidocella aquatica]|uniref:Putative 4-hydroxy-4-methyl-2-oxoglutarate aldolase n=1 Tax=Acidocella aquatica TaxID=1922313 RepID=A0ABQ6A6P6_9PROT|nr:RraA family protein [Acidocella aquatica]GLR66973.1 diguanylate cyclase [Acidocella aquatica]